MELATCEVRLNGDVLNTVIKPKVTPAELLVLRAVHGADSVVNVRVHAMNKRPHATELERLRSVYDRPNEEVFVVNALFPGTSANLPVTFKEIGVSEDEEGEEVDAEAAAALEEEIELKPSKKPKKAPLKEVLDMSDYDPEKDK